MNMFRFFQAIVNLGQDIMSTNENEPNALMREMDSTGTYHIWEGHITDDNHVHFCVRDGVCLFFRNSALVDGIIFVDNYYREMDWEEPQFEAPDEPQDLDGVVWDQIEKHNALHKGLSLRIWDASKDAWTNDALRPENEIERFVEKTFGHHLRAVKED